MKRTEIEEKAFDKYNNLAGKFDSTKDQVASKASDYAAKADDLVSKGMAGAESVKESLSELTQRITHNVEDAVTKGLKQVKTASASTETFVKKYPLYTVAGAVAVSFLAGVIIGKTSNKR